MRGLLLLKLYYIQHRIQPMACEVKVRVMNEYELGVENLLNSYKPDIKGLVRLSVFFKMP